MGLRIGTNVGALNALRNLRISGQKEANTLERLSTGRAINRGSDNPSLFLLHEQMRGELAAIQQASENSQNALNMVNVADAALGSISDRLVELRGHIVAAQNSGIVGPEGQAALQSAINQSLSAIDRVAQTTRFGNQGLLNGNLGFNVTGVSSQLTRVDVQGGNFPGGFPQSVDVSVLSAATQAQAGGTIAAGGQAGDATFRVTGPLGTADITVAGGSSQNQVIAAVNAETANTGVEATGAGVIRTQQYGSAATLNVQNLQGSLTGVTTGFTRGTDISAQVNGQAASGRGNAIDFQGNFQAEITVQAGATGTFQFTIEGGGAGFQLGSVPGGANFTALGVGPTGTSFLGISSGMGTLRDLQTGGPASLSGDPARGVQIVDAAAKEVGALRGRLGAVAQQVFEPNIRSLDVAFENLSASRSRIGDADFAEEMAASIRNRLLRETGLQVLKKANLNAGMALRLLS